MAIDVSTPFGFDCYGNSTTTPLGSSGVFTGAFQDVSNCAVLNISIFADTVSASNGFEFQWSGNGVDIDKSEGTNVVANSGRAFAIAPRAKYFRLKYTNGATAQTVFRLAVNRHIYGTGLISRPLSQSLNDDNFAQTVRTATNFQKTDGTYGPGKIDSDGGIVIAGLVGNVPAATTISKLTADGKVFSMSISFNLASADSDNPIFLIRNPSGSGKTLYLYRLVAGINVNNVLGRFKLKKDPTVTSNGTSQTPVNNLIGSSATSSMNTYSAPTLSAGGTQLTQITFSQNGPSIDFLGDFSIQVQAGHDLLITGDPQSNNREATVTVVWAEA